MTIQSPITSVDPFISVVIPTIPSRSHKRVVDRLTGVDTEEPYEVIVVNDSEKDICEARNVGIKKASGKVIALTDDDCRPQESWLSRIESHFLDNPDLVCLEGRVRGGFNYTGERHYVGCNLCFKRDAALEIGGFDSDFAGWRDDTEFGWRIERMGECIYDDELVMDHPADPGSSIDIEIEERLKEQYPDLYHKILIPDTVLERVNNWLWKSGFFKQLDKVRT